MSWNPKFGIRRIYASKKWHSSTIFHYDKIYRSHFQTSLYHPKSKPTLKLKIGNYFYKFVGNKAKGESQSGCFKKTKHAKFSEKRTFVTPWYAYVRTCTYHRVRNVCFLENLACFIFLKQPFWDSPFCLITDELAPSLGVW